MSGVVSDHKLEDSDSCSRSRCGTTLLLAVLAAGVMQIFRFDAQFDRWIIFVESGIVALYVVFLFRHGRRFPGGSVRMPGSLQALLALLVVAPVLVQLISRPLTGAGDPYEIVMLLCIQNAALGAAAVGHWRRASGISFLLSGFLVLFVTAMTESRVAFVLAAVFGLTGMWWLMTAYWDRLQGRFAVEMTRQVPVRTGVIAATLFVLLIGTALAGLTARSTAFVLPGFMPTSGGNRWADPFARAGVGDGDMLVAGQDHALSFGPVDSELFLESEMPSLYDVFNDTYGGKIRKSERAISLSAENFKENHQKIAQSKQSGREFSTLRRLTKRWRKRLEDREAAAMFYVVGKTPLHLSMENYETFDGVVWACKQEDPTTPEIKLQEIGEKPWITAKRRCGYPLFAGTQRHAVKIINLDTNRIPTPSHLSAWHIDRVDHLDFFDWSYDGIPAMPVRDSIPQLTVIQLLSHQMNLQPLREAGETALCRTDEMAPYLAVPDSINQDRIAELIQDWTGGIRAGWQQVEAVVEHLRTEFEHDPAATAPEDCEDTVSHFLTARRGPDYLFASAAAVMLRKLGYPSRVVSGFYADPQDYDPRGRQTIVNDDDVHLWVEVCIDGRTWIPVEPTPGYEPPLTVLSWSQRLAKTVQVVFRWVCRNALLSAALFCVGIAVIVYRRETFDVASYAFWSTLSLGSTRRRILWTVWLLEWRGWMAGRRRPANRTLRQWYEPVAIDADPEEAESLRSLITLADWVRYHPAQLRGTQWPYTSREILKRCRTVGRRWTSRRLVRQGRARQSSPQPTLTPTNAK